MFGRYGSQVVPTFRSPRIECASDRVCRVIAYKLYFLRAPLHGAHVSDAGRQLAGGRVHGRARRDRGYESRSTRESARSARSRIAPAPFALLGDGLHELRDVGTGVRLFYVLLPDNHAALLDGMTKKRDDIPDAMMKRLRTLQGAVYAEFKRPKKGR